jgi:hypothetical protein
MAAKRGPTAINLFVLKSLFGDRGNCIPNRVQQADRPHARRLLEFGLLQITDEGAKLCLTELGREALKTMEAAAS